MFTETKIFEKQRLQRCIGFSEHFFMKALFAKTQK